MDQICKSDAYHSLSMTPIAIVATRSRHAGTGRRFRPSRHLCRQSCPVPIQALWYAQRTASGIASSSTPCVVAGLIKPGALAGYRNGAVYLGTSRDVPPRWEAVRDAMPVLFDLIEQEPEPSVRAVLAHWLLGYIHPYPDGNGRMARFMMNAMLASGGYPWTVIVSRTA